jgi:pimeloyl-ACP methyl ester carboxylesterase
MARRPYGKTIRRFGADVPEAILLLAGFGDDGSMFSALSGTELASQYRLITVDLPGFGTARPHRGKTLLKSLARIVNAVAEQEGARIVVGHSLASITSSIAARTPGSVIKGVISLEGNLTPADAYFSGWAATFDQAEDFFLAFLERLEALAANDAILQRYLSIVCNADPRSLWELGRDAFKFSSANIPGDILMTLDSVYYLYNPSNCPPESLAWLETNPIPRSILKGASHWATIDQPHSVSEHILQIMGLWSGGD